MREQKNLNAVETEYIILTCYPEYNYMRKAIQLGCSDYLIKPVDYDDLAGVIDKTVRTIRNNRLCQASAPAPENESGASGNLISDKLIPYVKEHLCEHLTITDMARYLALNPQYMMRLFKKTTGVSILEYVTAEKMKWPGISCAQPNGATRSYPITWAMAVPDILSSFSKTSII